MITAKEMRKYLRDQFGIRTEKELDRELKKIGGIRIALFVDEPQEKKALQQG